jgi:hypothetical protein
MTQNGNVTALKRRHLAMRSQCLSNASALLAHHCLERPLSDDRLGDYSR